jgi:flagellar basal body-associated protein FliL
MIAIVLIIGVIGASVWFVYGDKADIHWPDIRIKRLTGTEAGTETVACKVVSNMGTNGLLLRFNMVIPCEDKDQKADLTKQMSRVKSDLLVHLDQAEMARWVRERNFESIKSELLKIVNRHSKRPVNEIFFDSFNY